MQTPPIPQGRWSLDPLHCTVEFTARHMAISKVRGRFTRFDAQVDVGPTLDSTTLTAEVDLSSVDTGNAQRDAHLRGTDFFNVDRSPTMQFTSRRIEPAPAGVGTYLIVGDLMLNGVTRDLVLDVRFHGIETFPQDGSTHAGLEAVGQLRRSEYGIDFNVPLAAGGVVISDRIGIELDIQLQPVSELESVTS